MHAVRAPHRQPQRCSLAGPLAGVLAVVCLVQFHLLLRPRASTYTSVGVDVHSDVHDLFASSAGSKGGQQQHLAASAFAAHAGLGAATGASDDPTLQAAGDDDAPDMGEALQKAAAVAAAAALEAGVDLSADDGGHAATLERLRGASSVFLTFANGAFADFISNWVLSVQRVGVPFLVGALDSEMVETAEANGWPYLDISALSGGNGSFSGTFFRANFATFRNMGATKVQLALTMLEELEVQTLVVSDSDTVWLREPLDYLDQHPTADFFLSTDCLSHEVERTWKQWHNYPRCGHIPHNGWGQAFNTGVFALRNRPAARELLEQWRDLLQDPSQATATTWNNKTLTITDQLALNIILDKGKHGPFNASTEDDHVLALNVLPRAGTLLLHPLSSLLFAGGHVAFVQRLPWRHGVEPIVVHATFQRFSFNHQRLGKRGRFREFGMWYADGVEYYNPQVPRYLEYDNDVRAVVDSLEVPQFPAGPPLLYKHLAAVSYQLWLFRDALAMATMLNRTLVLPKSWCWCDYDWTPHVLERCRIRGSDLQLPFECPADFVFHIPEMERQGLDFRMPGFLELPLVPDEVKRGRSRAQVLPAEPVLRPMPEGVVFAGPSAIGAAPSATHPTGVLWLGMTEKELHTSLEPLNQTAVVSISGMQPGLLAGFTDAERQATFDALYTNVTRMLNWCCAAEPASTPWGTFQFHMPQPFAAGYTPWTPPVLKLPDYCDKQLGPPHLKENTIYAHYANHPCQFLRNETAARIAAALT